MSTSRLAAWVCVAALLCASCDRRNVSSASQGLATVEPAPSSSSVLYQLDLVDLERHPTLLPAGATIVKEGPSGERCLRVTVTPPANGAPETMMIGIPVELTTWRGMQVVLTAKVRAEGVTTPKVSHHGVKLQMRYESPSVGKAWPGLLDTSGTFEWKEVSVVLPIARDAANGFLQVGLQGSSGTVWVSDVRVLAWRHAPVRPASLAEAPARFRGANLPPRLRGVVSPNAFKAEDFDTLAKWNVNVIRWQMTRAWGKVNTDLDLAEYDRWMDAELDDLAKALDAAAARGIAMIIDVHSPPGGRLPDRSLRMLFEQKYADHFVTLWERIATRFRNHRAVWAYDLVNEPIQSRPSPPGMLDYWELQLRAARAVRKIDAETQILFQVDQADAPQAFEFIGPAGVPNSIYQVHMYQPHDFTHQGVSRWGASPDDATVTYPAVRQTRDQARENLRRILKPVRDFQIAYNIPILVGEFSAIRWAPGAADYLEDCIALFEEYGWDWTYHAFREWDGWSVEHENGPDGAAKPALAKQPTDRFLVLKKWFDQNQRPTLRN